MIRRHPLSRTGMAVLETALVLPLLLLLSFGLVEYGHYFYVKHTLQGAAREGVRAAVPQNTTNADVAAAISRAMTAAGMGGSGYKVTYSPADVASATEGTQMTIAVECTWGTVGLRPMKLIPSAKKVVGTVVMRKEGI